ncbi:integrase core domain-containing protein [Pseudomonas costantinii]|uniref:Transposase InsO and inactivated derivatives n=5 Tax=Pseudomonas costantinii TaxID=168469 RepID=A0A1H5GC47_9PSED|nr:integrase core domain-containing protein [Pseudomonas costantinii]NVZ23882.1 transposase [Pseudomonas costantinii]SED48355.1 Transposase InsO and inactivated derivatives [Pseudomonas costantinii]SEE13150.1 Transposase InsO and inactivated derivatives [Pseudomonas costantinii]SEE30543.1 Transposase InsO and inactivated derivatives [Pseudomonas costantinii]
MPWRELKPMDLKVMFIADYLSERLNFSQLCAAHSISRKTGYKWVARYNADSVNGLKECSRKRHSQSQAVPFAVKEAILELRARGPTTAGPKKIQMALIERFPDQPPPSKTTIYNVLKKAGLVTPRPLRQRVAVYPKPLQKADNPNQLWSADYKGQYLTGDGAWCYPLTVMDHASRFLLACESMPSTTFQEAKAAFERLFKTYGMPERIRTDNGVPFASSGRAGLSQLSIWWARLGIIHERIQPGRPEQNGRHERMHRTLKSTLPRPPEVDWGAQQRHFDLFIQHYNHERVHEALGQKTPGSCYTNSQRMYPEQLPKMRYPTHVEAYRVDSNGVVYRGRLRIYVGNVLKHEIVGLESISEGVWDIVFGPIVLGRIDEKDVKEDYVTLKVIRSK